MGLFDDPFSGTLSEATRRALGISRAVDRAREAAGLAGPVRDALDEMARGQDVRRQLGLMPGPTPSQYDTIRKATEAHDAFMAKLNGTGLLDPRTGAIKLHDPYDGMGLETARKIHEQMEIMDRSMLGLGGAVHHAHLLAGQRDMLATADRNARWANHLMAHQGDIGQLLGISPGKLGDVLDGARAIAGNFRYDEEATALRRATALTSERVDQTIARMAGLAGSLAMTGPASAATAAATISLLGRWETRPDLPADYYRDRTARTRLYRDADVDAGVVEADRGELVEVLVESGLVEGDQTRSGKTVAVVRIGDQKVRIASSRPGPGAFVLIDTVDQALKRLIDTTMTALNGNEWLADRLRGSAGALEKLQAKRQAAMRAGEPKQRLVHYLDLGELMDIVNDKRNWPSFEPVFVDKTMFVADLRRLNYIRRPVVHGRGIDQVQLLEAVAVSHRLIAAIERPGAIDDGWDADD